MVLLWPKTVPFVLFLRCCVFRAYGSIQTFLLQTEEYYCIQLDPLQPVAQYK